MELLGKSLEDLFQENRKKFSLKTVCMVAGQMLDRIEFIHNKHIIHRDIKPDNFVIGEGAKNSTIYILDFGLAKKYRSSRTLQHIRFTINKKLTQKLNVIIKDKREFVQFFGASEHSAESYIGSRCMTRKEYDEWGKSGVHHKFFYI